MDVRGEREREGKGKENIWREKERGIEAGGPRNPIETRLDLTFSFVFHTKKQTCRKKVVT